MIKAANLFVLALNSSVSLPSLISTLLHPPAFISTFHFHFRLALDRVHERPLDVIEKHDAKE